MTQRWKRKRTYVILKDFSNLLVLWMDTRDHFEILEIIFEILSFLEIIFRFLLRRKTDTVDHKGLVKTPTRVSSNSS